MRQRLTPSTSGLPSLMMPCPACADRMVFHCQRAIGDGLEDSVYRCRRCDTELVRTSVRPTTERKTAA